MRFPIVSKWISCFIECWISFFLSEKALWTLLCNLFTSHMAEAQPTHALTKLFINPEINCFAVFVVRSWWVCRCHHNFFFSAFLRFCAAVWVLFDCAHISSFNTCASVRPFAMHPSSTTWQTHSAILFIYFICRPYVIIVQIHYSNKISNNWQPTIFYCFVMNRNYFWNTSVCVLTLCVNSFFFCGAFDMRIYHP